MLECDADLFLMTVCHHPALAKVVTFRGKDPERKMSQRAVGPVGEHLLHDGVVAMLALGLDQLVLPVRSLLIG